MQRLGCFEIGEVVDVAIEYCGDVGAAHLIGLFRVERMCVGLTDNANAGPASMAEDNCFDIWRIKRMAKQRVRNDRSAKRSGVVAEFTDLGRCFINKTQMTGGRAHGH